MTRRVIILLAALVAFITVAIFLWLRAQPSSAAYEELAALVKRTDISAAVQSANLAEPRDVQALDRQWKREAEAGNKGPMIDLVIASTLSRQLLVDRLASNGHVVQIMVMDKRGLLIAADAPTHDYIQSDEPKWQRTVGFGNVKPIFEGSEQRPMGKVDQISQAIVDTDGRPIGAITLRWCRTDGGCG